LGSADTPRRTPEQKGTARFKVCRGRRDSPQSGAQRKKLFSAEVKWSWISTLLYQGISEPEARTAVANSYLLTL